jgi:hypothetical protein
MVFLFSSILATERVPYTRGGGRRTTRGGARANNENAGRGRGVAGRNARGSKNANANLSNNIVSNPRENPISNFNSNNQDTSAYASFENSDDDEEFQKPMEHAYQSQRETRARAKQRGGGGTSRIETRATRSRGAVTTTGKAGGRNPRKLQKTTDDGGKVFSVDFLN